MFGFNWLIIELILLSFVLFFFVIIMVCFVKFVRIVDLLILIKGGVLIIMIWLGYWFENLLMVYVIFLLVSSLVERWWVWFVGIICNLLILVWYSILVMFLFLLSRYFIRLFWWLMWSVCVILGFNMFVLINNMVLFCLDVIFKVRFIVVNVLFLDGLVLFIMMMLLLFSVLDNVLNVFLSNLCLILWYFLLISFCVLFIDIKLCLFRFLRFRVSVFIFGDGGVDLEVLLVGGVIGVLGVFVIGGIVGVVFIWFVGVGVCWVCFLSVCFIVDVLGVLGCFVVVWVCFVLCFVVVFCCFCKVFLMLLFIIRIFLLN